MKNEPVITEDDEGRRVALVDIGRGRIATVLEADYQKLLSRHVSKNWCTSSDGKGREYVTAYFRGSKTTKGRVNIARLLLGLGYRETVVYRSRDRMDLRPENIACRRGFAKGKETFAVANAAA